jgi:hypothetical protein
VPDRDGPVVTAADRWLITGAVLTGSLLFGPIGLVVIAIGFVKMARAKKSGEFVRPAAVTLFGMVAMVDAAANFVDWSLDLWAHDIRIVEWAFTGWRRARRVGTRCRARRLAVLLLGNCRISGCDWRGMRWCHPQGGQRGHPWLSTQLCLAGRRRRHVVAPEL